MTNKADTTFWSGLYADVDPASAVIKNVLRSWIEKHFPAGQGKTCIEIGCHPGRYLSVFGERGYTLYGIDIVEKVKTLPELFRQKGYKTGTFWNSDFITFQPGRRFDVVASFGFLEHFTNWEEILKRHADLVGSGGHLIVEVPNFIGAVQGWIHKHLDKEGYGRHHIPAMDIEKWIPILRSEGFEVICKDYFGEFHFWLSHENRGIVKKILIKGLKISRRPLSALFPGNSRLYSPYGGVIAKRIQ